MAVNKGAARVNEEITINEKVATEALVRQYAQSSDFNDGDKILNIVNISSKPAMIAVEGYEILEDVSIMKWLGNKDSKVKPKEVDVVIFEAKDTSKK